MAQRKEKKDRKQFEAQTITVGQGLGWDRLEPTGTKRKADGTRTWKHGRSPGPSALGRSGLRIFLAGHQ